MTKTMTDELAKVLHDAARDSLAELTLDDEPAIPEGTCDEEGARIQATWILNHLRFGERMALAVEMASILHDLVDNKTVLISDMEVLLARWQERKP